MRVLVVYGGEGLSEEAEVSRWSGTAVLKAAQEAGIAAEPLVLDKDNLGQLMEIAATYDLVFLALHGEFGEDGKLQKQLEDKGIPFVGSGSKAMERCWDKAGYKNELDRAGILTPKYRKLTTLEELGAVNLPAVIKPVKGGSSLGVMIIRTESELDKVEIARSLKRYGSLLVEEFIDGREISVGVLGDNALPVIEIIPPAGRWFDYDAKYTGVSKEIAPTENIDPKIQKRARELALKIHQLMGCSDLSRTDMIVRGEDIFVLETNTMPGMTPQSLYPKEALAAGYPMSELIKKLVDLAGRVAG